MILKEVISLKLFGFIPYYREKDIATVSKLFEESKTCYDLAKQTSNLSEFISLWNAMAAKNKVICDYETKVPPADFPVFCSMIHKENEFQWRLRDAIERAKNAVLADLRGEHRNNINARVEQFCEDLNCIADLVDEESARFYLKSLYEVSDFAGLNVNKISLDNPSDAVPPMKDRGVSMQYDISSSNILTIDSMDGHAFEHWCANALRESGFTDVKVTPGSGDQGVDVLAQKDGIRYAIQCKCYASSLGNTPIQEVCAGKSFYRCHVGAVMTNQYFTPKAKELAEATGTLLWDRDWIISYLESHNADDLPTPLTTAQPKPDVMDDMLPAAVDIIMETGQASVSMIQRQLKLSYARAARIMDLMEELGIVGPYQGSRPRDILITSDQWRKHRSQLLK